MDDHGEYKRQDESNAAYGSQAGDRGYGSYTRPKGFSPGEDPWLREEEKRQRYHNRAAARAAAITVCVVILILAATLVLVRGNSSGPIAGGIFAEESTPNVVPGDGFSGQGPGNYADDYQEYFDQYFNENTDTALTTIPRADTGTGVTMHILASSGPELSLQTIYESCIPSIVSITAYLDGESYYWGTGIILTQDGYIITNAHVLEGTSSVTVALWDEREFEAKLVGSDSLSDLAVLKIEASGLMPAEFGDSDALRVGDRVAAIGNPLGEELRGTMTDGIVSAINRGIEYDGHTLTLIQTNAALNEGNSGGSLINMYGQVVGITNMKMSSSFSSIEGLGFAIPTQSMKDVVDALIADGRVLGRPALGITVGSVPKEAADYYTMPEGVYIESVSEKSDAYTKGIRHGDIITAVNGTAITAADEINEIKNTLSVGDSMTLTIYRDGESHDVTVVLMDAGDVY